MPRKTPKTSAPKKNLSPAARKPKPLARKAARPALPVQGMAIPAPSLAHKLLQARRREGERKLPPFPKVSVVVFNDNGVERLWNCLFSLKTQSYAPQEILLVDNRSTDSSLAFVRTNYPQVRILECQEKFGPSFGENLGVKCATGDLVALLNDHVVAPPDWLKHLVAAYQERQDRAGVVASVAVSGTGEVGSAPGSPAPLAAGGTTGAGGVNFLGRPFEEPYGSSSSPFYPASPALMLEPRFFPEGPFDADYQGPQRNLYLGWKARFQGRQVFMAEASKVFLQAEEDGTGLSAARGTFLEERNRLLNLLGFYGAGTLILVLPWVLLDAFGFFLSALFVPRRSLWGAVRAWAWLAFHPRLVLLKRQALQRRRRGEDGEILARMSGRISSHPGFFGRFVNGLSILYCRLAGLPVSEIKQRQNPL